MKALKLRIFQETACYRKPFSLKIWETYPLPPYSTIKGWLHKIISANEYIPMGISIQGWHETIIEDYRWLHIFGGSETKRPTKIHELYNVNLLIHVIAQEEILNKIYNCLSNVYEFPSIGRKEDLVRLDEIKIVSVKEIDLEETEEIFVLDWNVYIPEWFNEEFLNSRLTGIYYMINSKYTVENGIRYWDKTRVLYIERGKIIDEGRVFIDDDKTLVFPHVLQ